MHLCTATALYNNNIVGIMSNFMIVSHAAQSAAVSSLFLVNLKTREHINISKYIVQDNLCKSVRSTVRTKVLIKLLTKKGLIIVINTTSLPVLYMLV